MFAVIQKMPIKINLGLAQLEFSCEKKKTCKNSLLLVIQMCMDMHQYMASFAKLW